MSGVALRRYAVALQYHGSPFLGFSYQHDQEDAIQADGKTNLRGYHSVEGRLRRALSEMVGEDGWQNLQVSSRTDRGVHALHNTLHVDLSSSHAWDCHQLQNGLNFYLRRQFATYTAGHVLVDQSFVRRSPMNELRILNVRVAPEWMKNPYPNQPDRVPWNARFSATERTYAYRLRLGEGCDPWEWDRSWKIPQELNLDAMREAARDLVGTHDFSAFRAARCQRETPIATLHEVRVEHEPETLLGSTNIVTLWFRGDSFLYRQVRNMVGGLVEVGRGRLDSLKEILEGRNRRWAPSTAPAYGLFLVKVKHGDFIL